MDKIKQISIILPCFNSEKTLARTLESLITQTAFDQCEIIVMDGGSTDSTVSILKSYEKYFAILVSEKDSGITDAWNKALKYATAEWVFFIGSDDYLADKNVFRDFISRVENISNKLIYGRVYLTKPDGTVLREFNSPWTDVSPLFCKTSCLPHQGVFTRRTAFLEFGVFDTEFKIAADYDFMLRITKIEPPYFLADLPVAYFSVGGISSTLNTRLKALREIRKALVKNGFAGWNFYSLKAFASTHLQLTIAKFLGKRVLQILRSE